MYIKEPSTYEEQIESLRLKGFIVYMTLIVEFDR